jgi:DNA-binding NtrC family response regulator
MIAEAIMSPTKTNAFFDQPEDQWTEQVESDITSKRPPGVLVVDDDLGIRTLLNIVLREQGFAVWLTADGYQALKAYRGHRADIDLVLIDVRMPGLNGPQTLAALQQLNPQLHFCFMTGDPGRYTEQELMERSAERIIYKPFRLGEVAELVGQLVSRSPGSTPRLARAGM